MEVSEANKSGYEGRSLGNRYRHVCELVISKEATVPRALSRALPTRDIAE